MKTFTPAPKRFRVWNGAKMIGPDRTPTSSPEGGPVLRADGECAWITGAPDHEGWPMQHGVAMLSTGLTDADGVEVFEGDIVTAEWHWTEPHVVELPDDFYDFYEYAVVVDGRFDGRVVGNVFENPDLLPR